jgi:predicted nucleotidyltransferase
VILTFWLILNQDISPDLNFFIEAELSNLLGRKVDLQTTNFLNPEIRQSALSEAVIVYEQAEP